MGNGVIRRNTPAEDYQLDLGLAFNDILREDIALKRVRPIVEVDVILLEFDNIQEQIVGITWEEQK